jgi:hypothetical protein
LYLITVSKYTTVFISIIERSALVWFGCLPAGTPPLKKTRGVTGVGGGGADMTGQHFARSI